jgi:signal transduction histidine kinase
LDQLTESVARQGDRLALLVANLLDVARLAEGQWKADWSQVELVALVQRAIDELSSLQSLYGSQLRLHASGPIHGLWDAMGLYQVVANLLSNAMKYGGGKPVDVTVDQRPGWAVVRVQDAGIGVEPESLERIFGRFERGASARNYAGLGLGLFIVRQIVEAHEGHVRVKSALGAGSTFEVELPTKTSDAGG